MTAGFLKPMLPIPRALKTLPSSNADEVVSEACAVPGQDDEK